MTDEFLALGRNGITKILNAQMSRRLAKVQWTWDGKQQVPTLTIHAVGGSQGTTRVNQTIVASDKPLILQDGDLISLESPDESTFDYHVQITLADSPAVDMSTHETAAQEVSSSSSSSPAHMEHIQEFTCAICLEIMVEPVTAVPCGHSFCKECLATSVQQCPTCCTAFQCQPFLSRSLDHAIALLVDLQPHLFASDDVQQYTSRTKRTAPLPPSAQPASALAARKRARRCINESSGKTIGDAIVID
jgi:hypothetical protein